MHGIVRQPIGHMNKCLEILKKPTGTMIANTSATLTKMMFGRDYSIKRSSCSSVATAASEATIVITIVIEEAEVNEDRQSNHCNSHLWILDSGQVDHIIVNI